MAGPPGTNERLRTTPRRPAHGKMKSLRVVSWAKKGDGVERDEGDLWRFWLILRSPFLSFWGTWDRPER